MPIELANADCLTVELEENAYDALLSDAPYGLSFMGSDWDAGVPSPDVWKNLARALKPGAHLLVFGGTRTFHHLARSLELAGLEIRDTLCWLYGQGFPKSLSVSKAIDKAKGATREIIGSRTLSGSAALTTQEKGGTYAAGTSSAGRSVSVPITAPATDLAKQWEGYGSALKPAWEPIILARKPLDGTIAANVEKWGCGALNIDAARIGRNPDDTATGWWTTGSKASENRAMSGANYERPAKAAPGETIPARWPANLLLDEDAAIALDAQTSELKSRANKQPSLGGGGSFGHAKMEHPFVSYGDSGGASRFFYTAKASRSERESGLDAPFYREPLFANGTIRRCETHDQPVRSCSNEYTCGCPIAYGLPLEPRPQRYGSIQDGRTSEGSDYDRAPVRNTHPTVKPIKLTEYLATLLLLPNPDARLLVPFCGSGSEIIGARNAGWNNITGIEIDDKYLTIARKRLGLPI